MKATLEKTIGGVVWGEKHFSIPIDTVEANKLREALGLLNKHEKVALREYKYNPKKESDWCEIGYAVKNDKVIVIVRDGMAG